jgi:hypothetical protein
VGDERRHVGGEEVLAVSTPDDQRRVPAGPDDHIRRIGVDGDQGECSSELAAHLPHRLAEVAAGGGIDVLEQVRHDLGVGVGSELVPSLGEVFA